MDGGVELKRSLEKEEGTGDCSLFLCLCGDAAVGDSHGSSVADCVGNGGVRSRAEGARGSEEKNQSKEVGRKGLRRCSNM